MGYGLDFSFGFCFSWLVLRLCLLFDLDLWCSFGIRIGVVGVGLLGLWTLLGDLTTLVVSCWGVLFCGCLPISRFCAFEVGFVFACYLFGLPFEFWVLFILV